MEHLSIDQQATTIKGYQLKVSLRDIAPLIWRRLLVTNDTTVAQLHTMLQIAMGWEDVHLHRFRIHGKDYGISRVGGILFAANPHQVRLSAFRLRARERFRYEYDMGDGWQHDIRLERLLPLNPATTYPVCIDGAGDCPPEDGGGPSGYRAFLAEHYSLLELLQAREDVVLVAQRLLDFLNGGRGRPSTMRSSWMRSIECGIG